MDNRLFLAAGAVAIAMVGGAALWMGSDRSPAALGSRRASAGDVAGARAIWDAACFASPPDSRACVLAAESRLFREDIDRARPFAERALAGDPSDLGGLLLRGALAEMSGRPEAAREAYLAARTMHPASGLPPARLAVLAAASGDLPEAQRWSDEALALEPALGAAHAARGEVFFTAGKMIDAAESFGRAVDLDRNDDLSRVRLADVLGVVGDHGRRAGLLREVVTRHPDDPRVRIALGNALGMTGAIEEAAEHLRLASDLDPDSATPHLALGEAYLHSNRPEFAEARFREALEREPGLTEARYLLSLALERVGRPDEALRELDEILAGDTLDRGEEIETRMRRALLAYQLSGTAAANPDIEAILAIEPEHEEANWLSGHMLLEEKRYDEAASRINAALAHQPPRPGAVFDHARLLAHAGDKESALRELASLAIQGQLYPAEVKAQPEFAGMAEDRAFRMLLEEVANPDPAGLEPPGSAVEGGLPLSTVTPPPSIPATPPESAP